MLAVDVLLLGLIVSFQMLNFFVVYAFLRENE